VVARKPKYVGRQHFFFQAEDGIRDLYVTGVQTCALPICGRAAHVEADDAVEARGEGGPHRADDAARRPRQDRILALEAARVGERSEERRVGKEGRGRWSPRD